MLGRLVTLAAVAAVGAATSLDLHLFDLTVYPKAVRAWVGAGRGASRRGTRACATSMMSHLDGAALANPPPPHHIPITHAL
jgi:hypothetical protein